jgi:hypothetical protein
VNIFRFSFLEVICFCWRRILKIRLQFTSKLEVNWFLEVNFGGELFLEANFGGEVVLEVNWHWFVAVGYSPVSRKKTKRALSFNCLLALRGQDEPKAERTTTDDRIFNVET